MLFTYSKSYTAIGKEVRKLINEVYFCLSENHKLLNKLFPNYFQVIKY